MRNVLISIGLFMIALWAMSAYNPQAMSFTRTCTVADSIGQLLGYMKKVQADTLYKPISYTAPVTSVNGLTGVVTIPSGSVTSVGASSTDLDVTGVPITSSGIMVFNIKSVNKLKWDTAYDYRTQYFNRSGRILSTVKIWIDTLTPTTATNFSVNISSASFSTIRSISVTPISSLGYPLWPETTISLTALSISLYKPNTSALTNILGLLVPVGNPFPTATNLNSIRLAIRVDGA